jgi:hypothetical protein
MHCAGTKLKDGVQSFVRPGPDQTIPVSHFGDICKAKIWLIGMNPEGGDDPRKDSNVGFIPIDFQSRVQLTHAQVAETFDHSSTYFRRPGYHRFFNPWIERLNGIELSGQARGWQEGGICCVDLVKCPTKLAWQNVFHDKDKSAVKHDRSLIYGCFKESGPNYLEQQVELHNPQVLIFSGGLAVYYRKKGSNQKSLKADLIHRMPQMKEACAGIWTVDSPPRLSIGLRSKRTLDQIDARKVTEAIQSVIVDWERKKSAVDR